MKAIQTRRPLPPLSSLPEKWQREYHRVLALASARYKGQWGGEEECRYIIHGYVVDCWEQEQDQAAKAKSVEAQIGQPWEQGLLFG